MAQPHLYYDTSPELWLQPPSSKDHRLESGTIKRPFDFYHIGGFEEAMAENEEEGEGEEEDEMMVQVVEEGGSKRKKKARRLSLQQVKALEMAFDANNKLEAERKVELANKVGLEARQVAIWFQNRRARWKTKQMEGDFTTLKAQFQSLKAQRDALLIDKQLLQDQVARLKNQSTGGKKQVAEETHVNMEEFACMNNMNVAVADKQKKDDLDLHMSVSNTRIEYSDDDEKEESSSISIANASPRKIRMAFNSAVLEANDCPWQIRASADSDSGSSRAKSSIQFQYIKGEEGGLCEETRYPFSLFEW